MNVDRATTPAPSTPPLPHTRRGTAHPQGGAAGSLNECHVRDLQSCTRSRVALRSRRALPSLAISCHHQESTSDALMSFLTMRNGARKNFSKT